MKSSREIYIYCLKLALFVGVGFFLAHCGFTKLEMRLLSIPILIVILIISIFQVHFVTKRKKYFENQLRGLLDFTVTLKVMRPDQVKGIAVDEEKGRICLMEFLNKRGIMKMVEYRDLLSTEIIEDGMPLTRVNRTGITGCALLQKLTIEDEAVNSANIPATGWSSEEPAEVNLRLIVNDPRKPVFMFNLLEGPEKVAYADAVKQARAMHSLLERLIKRADQEDAK